MRRKFKDLTIRDAFMFAAVMADGERCRLFLAMALEMDILEVKVITEKTIAYHPEYHGVRLDVLAEENGTKRRFNVEMQIRSLKGLPQRTRLYHAQMDMDALLAGAYYDELPDTYVIFICDFDPFMDRRYRYTFQNICSETGKPLRDGNFTIFLSTKGENESEVPKELVKFLEYVENPDGVSSSQDAYVRSLDSQVDAIKRNRDWEAKFMLLEEMMKEERSEGKAEGKAEDILAILESRGNVPEHIRSQILGEKNLEKLIRWFSDALSAKNVDDFFEKM